MSTAARKARKKNNARMRAIGLEPTRFQHPVKEYTPIIDRAENKPQRFSDGTRTTSAARKRIASAAEVLFADNAVDEGPQLDPKPWRAGRRRYESAEAAHEELATDAVDVIFSPRKGYATDPALYV